MLIKRTAGLSNDWVESYGVFWDDLDLFNKGIIEAMTTFYKLQEYLDGDLHNMICGSLCCFGTRTNVPDNKAATSRRLGLIFSFIGLGCLLGPTVANFTIKADRPTTMQLICIGLLAFMMFR